MGLSKNQPLSAHQWIGITPRFLFSRRLVCLAWPGPCPCPVWSPGPACRSGLRSCLLLSGLPCLLVCPGLALPWFARPALSLVCACGARAGSVPALPGPSETLSRKLDVILPYSLATISKLVIDGLAQARSATAAAEEASEDFTTASAFRCPVWLSQLRVTVSVSPVFHRRRHGLLVRSPPPLSCFAQDAQGSGRVAKDLCDPSRIDSAPGFQ